ncbi:MAG: CDGSH iron-sulfur domain-containing protein [Gemmatimonadota bacterium]
MTDDEIPSSDAESPDGAGGTPTKPLLRYAGERVTITYDPLRCIHAGKCVEALGEVFDPNRRPWVDSDAAPPARICEAVMRCPSGALHYERLDGRPAEPMPARNMVTVAPDGPLYARGELEIETADGVVLESRAALCRCGESENKPFCDGSHKRIDFKHDGGFELGEPIAPPASETDGPLLVRPSKRGPLLLSGVLELRSADLKTYARMQHPALCRCGHSGLKPFCDGTHHDIGFDR